MSAFEAHDRAARFPITKRVANRADFEAAYPGVFFLDPAETVVLEAYLKEASVLEGGELVARAGPAGVGGMNCTVRVATNRRSVIVKQARPWVENSPQNSAPWDRALREIAFYELVAGDPVVSRSMPAMLHADRRARLLVLEDVGAGVDYTGIYRGENLEERAVDQLADYLTALHAVLGTRVASAELANREMRALKRAHLFFIPLQADNGLDLDAVLPGLAGGARVLREDEAFNSMVARLGHEAYMASGTSLVHGDFYPGSFLRARPGPRIIDAECCFTGRAEFDVGVFLAHLLLGRLPGQLSERFLARYQTPGRWDEALVLRFAGVEIMRRLIGYGQLPLGYGLEARLDLLKLARRLVLDPQRDLIYGL
ncbi:MAG: phosphotransferase [Verrucomicrobiales bacterium]|nr:phosphotransferase [Verrucomicrobiales bacterium]